MRTLPALAAVLLCATSCQKSLFFDDTHRDPVPDNVRLTKMILLDPTQASPIDTHKISTFIYNAAGLVTGIDEVTNPYGPATGPGRTGYQTISYYYAGADTKPYKSVSKIWGGNTPPGTWETFDTCWYNYNSAGRKLNDSTVSWQYKNGVPFAGYGNTFVYRFSYYNDSIVQTRITGSTDNYTTVPNITKDKAELNGAGQVVKTVYYPREYDYTLSDYVAGRQYNYSAVINPVSRLNIFSSLGAMPLSEGSGQFFGDKHFLTQLNVLSSIVTNYDAHPAATETMTTTVNSHNLPLTYTSSNPLFFKVVFVYSE